MRRHRFLIMIATATAVAVALASCANTPQTAHGQARCDSYLAEAMWDLYADLAAQGLAANPQALAEASAGAALLDGNAVELPSYSNAQENLNSAERATLYAAMSSTEVGTGHIVTETQLSAPLEASGLCD